jgi:hypothetical protein
MMKIIPILLIGILILSGLGTGAAIGEITKQKTMQSHNNIQMLNNGGFDIRAKYSYIRSYRGGGGIFIISMAPKNGFSGLVFLQIKGDSNLNAQLHRRILNKESEVAELTINPNEFAEIKTHQIIITAIHFKMPILTTILYLISKIIPARSQYSTNHLYDCHDIGSLTTPLFDIRKLVLEVEMFNWSSDNLPDAIIKRNELIEWLEVEHPEFDTFSDINSFAYVTYPSHLVVEHWTFLYEEWEMRVCYHVMIPPYDWSKIYLRKRGEVDAVFAAKRESDDTTYEISLSEYPTYYGY